MIKIFYHRKEWGERNAFMKILNNLNISGGFFFLSHKEEKRKGENAEDGIGSGISGKMLLTGAFPGSMIGGGVKAGRK